MKQALILLTVVTMALGAAVGDKLRVKRAALAAMEKSFDNRILKISVENPFDLLGTTRGMYLDGYGAVFTTEVNLVVTAPLSPFRQSISKEEVARLRLAKLQRLPLLKLNMRDMLISAAASLDGVPANEQIVVGVSLFHFYWEDMNGLPSQIVMQAERQKLLDFQAARMNGLDTFIRTQEF